MHKFMVACTLAVLSGVVVLGSGAGAEKSAPSQEVRLPRETPVSRAVRKVRDSVVSVKVVKRSGGASRDVVGTGVIVDERGYIVTNRHVVYGADTIRVRQWDGTELAGEIQMHDPNYDLAVLRVRAEGPLQALPLGPAAGVEEGQDVIAIGSPYGFERTVSKGIVSNVGREITMPDGTRLTKLIQHDAPIDPGNSGGPLLDINGDLIGINVALHDKARGIAFALNADQVQQVLSKHLSALRLSGLAHGLVCKEDAADVDAPQVVVEGVEERTPAAQAGLQEGDHLVAVGRQTVRNRFDVERAFWAARSGEAFAVTLVRQGREMRLTLTMARGEAVSSR